ncbi:MAG: peptide-methionine (S)-S-oxide reductase [Sphaerobacteraceae bacterium]|nr:MAG: peptide-methionine (S)-S-oxide reductase [Sphaerobacteraceae bacterium]
MTNFATFGAGCFWGIEASYRKLDGVIDVAAGYAGGHTENPSYPDVCSGTTGHTEVVQVEYDPDVVSYQTLVDHFWSLHSPTMKEKPQYRSVIFTHSDEQAEVARQALEAMKASRNRELFTSIEPAPTFYRAEEYHQQYLVKHGVA